MQPRLGLQGPVVGWQDPWAGETSDRIMRTGTGVLVDSQDGYAPPEQFLALLDDLGADFYLHHVMPGLEGQSRMVADLAAAGIDVVLGNEYGNINGPFVADTNRYDVPTTALAEAAAAGILLGTLYDEPEHLQINADQYRKDAFLPQFGRTDATTAETAEKLIIDAIRGRADEVTAAVDSGGAAIPMIAEHVFPVMFHTFARAGMAPCPKVMKEAFQPLQLSTSLGAALQYDRPLWICADLWGPDIGPWFTRAPGFPGHSPAEYAAALRLAYLFGPTHLFTENVDVLARFIDGRFARTEFGEVWAEFVHDFVPRHPLTWSFRDARPSTVLIHAEDSNFGRGRRPFGDRQREAPAESNSIFAAWHLLSHGTLPAHGSCQHIDGYSSPRGQLKQIPREQFPLSRAVDHEPTTVHPLFHALNNAVVYDEQVDEQTLGAPELIMVAGSRLPRATLELLRRRAADGSTVVIAEWLTAPEWSQSRRIEDGHWIVTPDFAPDGAAADAIQPRLGRPDEWTQRFGDTTLRFTPDGTALDFELLA